MPSVAIIGASRGIGLGFAEAYAADGWTVHATTRTPEAPGMLGEIPGDVTIHGLDVRDGPQLLAMAGALDEALGEAGLDVLVHSAGVYGTGMSREEVWEVNVEAPFDVAGALLPDLERGAQKKLAILTSQMGARNGGGTPSGLYGASKCALNDRFREVEPEWRARGITAVVFHPGWVATEMGGRSAPVSVAESVAGMRRVIEDLTPDQAGSFLTWQGKVHPW